MKGFVEISKVYADGRKETVCEDHNILTDSLGVSVANIFSDNGSSNISDHIIGYFQVGGGHLTTDQDSFNNRFISNLDSPFSENQYGDNAERLVTTHNLKKLHATNFSPSIEERVSKESFVSLSNHYSSKVIDNVVHFRIELPESMGNGYTISEFGLFSKNPSGERGTDKSLLLAYKQFPSDEAITKSSEFSLVVDWQIKFVDENKDSEALVAGGEGGGPPNSDEKYNVVFIMLDDVGFDYLGLYDSKNAFDLSSAGYPNANAFSQLESPDGCGIYPHTPTLSALASSGLLFYNTRAMPMCSPTRSTIMAGKYNFSCKHTGQDENGNLLPAVWGPGYGKVTGDGTVGQKAKQTLRSTRSGLAAFNVEYPFQQYNNNILTEAGSQAYENGDYAVLSDAVRDAFNQPNTIAKQKVFAEYLKDIGYHSAFFGKWHLANWEDEVIYSEEDDVLTSAPAKATMLVEGSPFGGLGAFDVAQALDGSGIKITALKKKNLAPTVFTDPNGVDYISEGDDPDNLSLIFRFADMDAAGYPESDHTHIAYQDAPFNGGTGLYPAYHWLSGYEDGVDQVVIPYKWSQIGGTQAFQSEGIAGWIAFKLTRAIQWAFTAYATPMHKMSGSGGQTPSFGWSVFEHKGYKACASLDWILDSLLDSYGIGTHGVGHRMRALRTNHPIGQGGDPEIKTLVYLKQERAHPDGDTAITYFPEHLNSDANNSLFQYGNFTSDAFTGGTTEVLEDGPGKQYGESWGHVSSVGKWDHYVATWGNLNTGPRPGFETSSYTWENLAPGADQPGWPHFGNGTNGNGMGYVNYFALSGTNTRGVNQVLTVSDVGYTSVTQTASGEPYAQGAASSFATNFLLSEASSHFNDTSNCPEPFFMYVTTHAPHTPYTYPPSSLVHNPYYDNHHQQVAALSGSAENASATWINVNAQMENFDSSLSSFMEGLDHDRRSRTIFIVTSDNGSVSTDLTRRANFCSGTVGLGTSASVSQPFASNGSGGLGPTYDNLLNLGHYASSLSPSAVRRGGENDSANQFKASLYETGVLVPMIVYGGSASPVVSGQSTEAMVDLVDLLATVVHIGGGVDAVQDTQVPSDSKSFYPVLTGAVDASNHGRQFSYGEIFFPLGNSTGSSRKWGSYSGWAGRDTDNRVKLLNKNEGATFGSDTTSNNDDIPVQGDPLVPRRIRRTLSVRLKPTWFEGYLGNNSNAYGYTVQQALIANNHTGTVLYDKIPDASGGLWKILRPSGNGVTIEAQDEFQEDDSYGRFLEELYHTQSLSFASVDKYELEDYIPEAWKAFRDTEDPAANADGLVGKYILKQFVKQAVTEAGVTGTLDNSVHYWNLTRIYAAMQSGLGSFIFTRSDPTSAPFSTFTIQDEEDE